MAQRLSYVPRSQHVGTGPGLLEHKVGLLPQPASWCLRNPSGFSFYKVTPFPLAGVPPLNPGGGVGKGLLF